jgi:hypothetical protein
MGAAKATQQRGGSVGWSNVSPGVDAEWQTLRGSSDTIAAPNSPRVPVAITGARLTSDVKTVTTSSQQMSLTLGILLLNRLAEQLGVAVRSTSCIVHAFPRPEGVGERGAILTNFAAWGSANKKDVIC